MISYQIDTSGDDTVEDSNELTANRIKLDEIHEMMHHKQENLSMREYVGGESFGLGGHDRWHSHHVRDSNPNKSGLSNYKRRLKNKGKKKK